jgi:hypothetical protein
MGLKMDFMGVYGVIVGYGYGEVLQ